MPKTVGVLGGMGPEATAEFYKKLIELTPASRDQEHLPTLIVSDPRVPDRTEYILGSGESFLPQILHMAKDLERFGAEFIVMPCNTAHLFWQELADAVKIPVLNIIEETLDEIDRVINRRDQPIGVLATVGTIRSQIYQEALSRRGLIPLVPPESTQHEVHRAITLIKAQGDRCHSQRQVEQAVHALSEEGAKGVILGCTELGLAGEFEVEIPIFDSLEILAKATVRFAS